MISASFLVRYLVRSCQLGAHGSSEFISGMNICRMSLISHSIRHLIIMVFSKRKPCLLCKFSSVLNNKVTMMISLFFSECPVHFHLPLNSRFRCYLFRNSTTILQVQLQYQKRYTTRELHHSGTNDIPISQLLSGSRVHHTLSLAVW